MLPIRLEPVSMLHKGAMRLHWSWNLAKLHNLNLAKQWKSYFSWIFHKMHNFYVQFMFK